MPARDTSNVLSLPTHCWLSFGRWWWQQVIPGEVGGQLNNSKLLQDTKAVLRQAPENFRTEAFLELILSEARTCSGGDPFVCILRTSHPCEAHRKNCLIPSNAFTPLPLVGILALNVSDSMRDSCCPLLEG